MFESYTLTELLQFRVAWKRFFCQFYHMTTVLCVINCCRTMRLIAALMTVRNCSTDKPHCCYCNGPGRCSRVAKMEERKQILMKTGRCFVCLRKGHLCRSKQRCNVCGGKHHFSQTESATTGLNPASPPFQPPTPSNPRRPHWHCFAEVMLQGSI